MTSLSVKNTLDCYTNSPRQLLMKCMETLWRICILMSGWKGLKFCVNGDRAKFSYKPRVEEIQPEQFLDRDRPH